MLLYCTTLYCTALYCTVLPGTTWCCLDCLVLHERGAGVFFSPQITPDIPCPYIVYWLPPGALQDCGFFGPEIGKCTPEERYSLFYFQTLYCLILLPPGVLQDCGFFGPEIGKCTPEERYPGLWEVPLQQLQENDTLFGASSEYEGGVGGWLGGWLVAGGWWLGHPGL